MATIHKHLSSYDASSLPDAAKFRYGLVVSQWNEDITEGLAQGAFTTLAECGVPSEQITRWNVPGSFELVYGCQRMIAKHPEIDVIIAIGNVIQGETKHFDYVCQGVSQGIKDINLMGITPVIFCVLTDNNKQQSRDRSGGKHGNKGVEAAVAAVEMAALRSATQ